MAASNDGEFRHLNEFTAQAAETFVSAYYAAADSPQRLQVWLSIRAPIVIRSDLPLSIQILPTLYLGDSSIVWNGNPISGRQEFGAFLQQMPATKHEIQSFDCHPMGGGREAGEFNWNV